MPSVEERYLQALFGGNGQGLESEPDSFRQRDDLSQYLRVLFSDDTSQNFDLPEELRGVPQVSDQFNVANQPSIQPEPFEEEEFDPSVLDSLRQQPQAPVDETEELNARLDALRERMGETTFGENIGEVTKLVKQGLSDESVVAGVIAKLRREKDDLDDKQREQMFKRERQDREKAEKDQQRQRQEQAKEGRFKRLAENIFDPEKVVKSAAAVFADKVEGGIGFLADLDRRTIEGIDHVAERFGWVKPNDQGEALRDRTLYEKWRNRIIRNLAQAEQIASSNAWTDARQEYQQLHEEDLRQAYEDFGLPGQAAVDASQGALNLLWEWIMLRQATGVTYTSALKVIKGGRGLPDVAKRLTSSVAQNALKVSAFNFATVPAENMLDRTKSALMSFAFMMTPAVTARLPTNAQAKIADILSNLAVDVPVNWRETWEQSLEEASSQGRENEAFKFFLANLVPVMTPGAILGLMNRSIYAGHDLAKVHAQSRTDQGRFSVADELDAQKTLEKITSPVEKDLRSLEKPLETTLPEELGKVLQQDITQKQQAESRQKAREEQIGRLKERVAGKEERTLPVEATKPPKKKVKGPPEPSVQVQKFQARSARAVAKKIQALSQQTGKFKETREKLVRSAKILGIKTRGRGNQELANRIDEKLTPELLEETVQKINKILTSQGLQPVRPPIIQPVRFKSTRDFAKRIKRAAQQGFVELGDFRQSGEALGRMFKRAFAGGLRRGGLRKAENKVLNEAFGARVGASEELRQLRKRLKATQEWDHLTKQHGDEVRQDLADAMLTKQLDGFKAKYEGELARNSPTMQIAEKVVELDRLREPLLDSKNLTQAQKDAINANGSDYRKVSYLRWIMGDKFRKHVDPDTLQRAREELEAGILDDIGRINEGLQKGTRDPDVINRWKGLVEIGGDDVVQMIPHRERIAEAVNEQLEFYLTRSPKARRTSAEGLPMPHLMHRKLEGILKELYEPISDPVEQALLTIDAVESLSIQNAFLNKLLDVGEGISISTAKNRGGPGLRIKRDWKQLRGVRPNEFGRLEGAFVSPELHAALVQKIPDLPFRIFNRTLSVMRLSKLINPATMGRNRLSSFGFMLSRGDLLRKETWQSGTGSFARYKKLVKGVKRGDKEAMAEWRKLASNRILNPHGSSLTADMAFDTITKGGTGIAARIKKTPETLGRFYASIDFKAKAAAYYTHKARMEAKGMTEARAHEAAVEHVRKNYQDPRSIPKIANLMNRSGLTDFISYQFDSVRMRWNNLRDAITEAKEGDYTALTGFMAMTSMQAIGFNETRKLASKGIGKLYAIIKEEDPNIEEASNDEMQAARQLLPPYYRDNAFVMWYDAERTPYIMVMDPIYGYPVEAMLTGTMQQIGAAGPAEAAKGLGRNVLSRLAKPNMLLETIGKNWLGFSSQGRRTTNVFEELARTTEGTRSLREFGNILGDSIFNTFSEFVPADAVRVGKRVYEFIEAKKTDALLKDLEGSPVFRDPWELISSKISIARPLPIDMTRALAQFKASDIGRAIRNKKAEIGRISGITDIRKAQRRGVFQEDFSKAQRKQVKRLLGDLQQLYDEADNFVSAWDAVNRSKSTKKSRVDLKTRQTLLKGNFDAFFVRKGGGASFNKFARETTRKLGK